VDALTTRPEVEMSLATLTFDYPRTGLRARVTSADEQDGRYFELEYTAPPGSPRELVFPHRHASWTERFEVITGRARYRLGREEADLEAGESVELPPGIVHLHPWNAGPEELRVRQRTTLHQPDPRAIRETLEGFAMLAWLDRQGRLDRRGNPSLLQAAVILESMHRHGGSLPGLPVSVQGVLLAALAALGRRRGYRACDPAALAP
jgi:mannose-6-phosphate isomerase-like protein (cupin superfamily)